MMARTAPARIFDAPRTKTFHSRRLRAAFGAIVLAAMLLLCAPLFLDAIASDAPQPRDGELSYRNWGPLDAPVRIRGEWRFTWLGGEGSAPPGASGIAAVPGPWSEAQLAGAAEPGAGVGRYELIIRDLPPGRYTLHIPIVFGASRVLVDGKLVSQRGRLGGTEATTSEAVRSHEVAIDSSGAPVWLAVDIASFRHRDRGFAEAPVFGAASAMNDWISIEWARDLLFHSSLLLLAATAFVGFLFRRQDRGSLFLALAALSAIPGTAVLSYDNLLLIGLPGLGYAPMLAAQYIGSNFAVLFLVLYARALFPAEFPRGLFVPLVALIAAFLVAQSAAIALGSPLTASNFAVYWPLVSGLGFVGMLFAGCRAARHNRDGAIVFVLGIAVFTFFFLNATLAWSGLVPASMLLDTTTLPLGMLMLLFSHFVVMAERWSLAIVAAEQTNDDLRELIEVSSAIVSEMQLKALLARVLEATTRILNADRSSLLLHDPRTGELWSMVAEGLSERELRFPADEGLAGHAFTHGETLNITDAYADPRFKRELDTETGYETHSILTMPVATRDGRRLGVLQALNRRDGEPFSDNDVRRMSAFAAQAAIAIDNATLFSEVAAARNYNESILRSMASGVMTLDREASVTKLNAAARDLLGFAGDGDEPEAKTLLVDKNPALWAEIEGVGATGERKSLLDIDIVTATGGTISANLTIVPLIGESERVGLLVLIENISDSKRLKGAMRRFMTQNVVDQVLGRGDDLLFGTACEASILFGDIRNFTSLAESLSPRETVDILNEIFTELFEAVAASQGVLDKFIGDAIMAVYGAPLSTGRDPANAVESAVQMLRTIARLNERRAAAQRAPIRLGVGIATGDVVAGTIGSPKRMDYTVIGDSVNLAARLESLTKAYGVDVMICETTAAAVASTQRLRELDLIIVRGRQKPVKIFEVVAGGAATELDALIAAYQKGRERLACRDWTGAIEAFQAALSERPGDRPSQLMLERAETLAARPPEESWDGVWRAMA